MMMATSSENQEETDLITCAICFHSFDTEDHLPKFLPCVHSVCLQCLKPIARDGILICPLCRQSISCPDGNPDKLPTNQYALQIVKLQLASSKAPAPSPSIPTPKRWCLTCGCVAQPGCLLQDQPHCTMDPKSSTFAHMMHLVDLKRSFDRQVRRERVLRRGVLEVRQAVQIHLDDMAESLRSVTDEWREKEEENQLRIAELVSSPEEDVEDNDEIFLAQLVSIQKEEEDVKSKSIVLLEEKIKDLSATSEDELGRVGSLLEELKERKKHSIVVQVNKSKELSIPSDSTDPKLKLIHHLVSSILSENKKEDSVLVSMPTVTPKIIEEITFDLVVNHYGKKIGCISINPSTTFEPRFTLELAKFCSNSSQEISHLILKARQDSFLLWDCSAPGFQPVMKGTVSGKEKIKYKWDVGILVDKTADGAKLTGWRWNFYLKDFNRNGMDQSVLFGEVVADDTDVIKMLSSWKASERAGLTMHIKVKPRK